ncbi:hypothetical protein ACFYXP_29505 [Streptomyces sp. NPDC002466]|uniref:hypothetical protein n=1 Tax=unclassified Streptomyces TaxID=2593676 RepID=UPI00292A45F3|nr:hypothetical protein [Streptomyces sp. sk2.1]
MQALSASREPGRTTADDQETGNPDLSAPEIRVLGPVEVDGPAAPATVRASLSPLR